MREPLLLSKLQRKCDDVRRRQERVWVNAVADFGDHLHEVLHGDRAVDAAHVDALHECARLLDCCETIERDALGADAETVEQSVTSVVASEAASLDDFLEELLEDTPKRGYVYVAWTARPEEYWYVGRASREDRIRRHRQHGNLSLALRDASLFSIIFPAREVRLDDLEAALLRLLRHTDGAPVHNGSFLPKAPRRARREHLERISLVLTTLARRLA